MEEIAAERAGTAKKAMGWGRRRGARAEVRVALPQMQRGQPIPITRIHSTNLNPKP